MVLAPPDIQVDIDPELLEQYAEEKQIVIIVEEHLNADSVYVDPDIRLTDPATGAEARLVVAHNIPLYPDLIAVKSMPGPAHLVFNSLPEDCLRFTLSEPAVLI